MHLSHNYLFHQVSVQFCYKDKEQTDHSFGEHLLSSYGMPDPILAVEETEVKLDKALAFLKLNFKW